MRVVFALWLRELKRYLRSRPQILASLGQPSLPPSAPGYHHSGWNILVRLNFPCVLVAGMVKVRVALMRWMAGRLMA